MTDILTDLDELNAMATPRPWILIEPGASFDVPVLQNGAGGQLLRTNHYGLMRYDSRLVVTLVNNYEQLVKRLRAAEWVCRTTTLALRGDIGQENVEQALEAWGAVKEGK